MTRDQRPIFLISKSTVVPERFPPSQFGGFFYLKLENRTTLELSLQLETGLLDFRASYITVADHWMLKKLAPACSTGTDLPLLS